MPLSDRPRAVLIAPLAPTGTQPDSRAGSWP